MENNLIKNKYIHPVEVKKLLDNIPIKNDYLKKIICLVYNEGYKLNKAIAELGITKTGRTLERQIKKYSNRLIKLQDLRRSYILSHPNFNYSYYGKRNKKREPITPKLRWKIFTRDNFKCVVCGATSQEKLLHVDHILPVSLGGNNDFNNLRTLCAECNMGKGNQFLEIDLKHSKNKLNNTENQEI